MSAVGERTYGAAPTLFGGDVSSFQVEDLSFGWRSGKSVGSGENVLDFTVGRAPFKLGHGMLLWDGAAEGGSRGGYWTNARKAFEFAAIGRVHAGTHKVEAFYLDKDELPENDTGTRLWGANYEYALGEHSTFGATYMKFFADPAVKPERDGLNVFNLRAYTAPVPSAPDLSFEFEYASERNGDAAQLERLDAAGRVRVQQGVAGSRSSRIATRSSRATTRRRRATRASIRCCPASTTGATGGRARSPASTSPSTPT